ncbi:hypothetical protein COU12_01960 [Candidatus Jorgensenbacteria bacterium CG10_big_fil_rev_8_21_14_0_10_54_38]|uniref:PD-(D/E)XK endonuclease-like domain-containing protein n=2 Tax=Candidatus Joergenseniibacteriota TaxID=1752739 RepID=A0A2M6WFS0_9BACT|nr:MAG: hypothetical protein COX26_00265 [Candidatus Jorgensenbacteria bacterium CG23_combo_of_CG06-09_8_20_14_all_54_14]PIT91650.1 MAG: hypothetical protein COU12_01960 [Candidatus Jorgensenbacteria bacterium CG10_big_fil_rev_8_21_14_0_10_54_38]
MFYKTVEEFKKLAGYEIDGFWYPRVTKIIEIKSKPALYHFYGRMENFAAAEQVKRQSASEGTLIHETVEKILTGGQPSVPPQIEPSVKAFLEFLLKNHISVDPAYVEHRLVNYEHRYAGTLDAVAMIGGRLGILDIKTSQEIYRDYNLQTAAYLAAMKDAVKGLETRWILRIDQSRSCLHCGALLRSKGGREQIKTQWGNPFMQACTHEWGPMEGRIELKEFPYWQEDFDAFLGAKKLWEWENVDWLKQVGYL